jgi:hypothetical protein
VHRMAPPSSVTTMSAAAMQGWCLVATIRVLPASKGPCSVSSSSAAVWTSTAAKMSSHSHTDLSAPCKMDSRGIRSVFAFHWRDTFVCANNSCLFVEWHNDAHSKHASAVARMAGRLAPDTARERAQRVRTGRRTVLPRRSQRLLRPLPPCGQRPGPDRRRPARASSAPDPLPGPTRYSTCKANHWQGDTDDTTVKGGTNAHGDNPAANRAASLPQMLLKRCVDTAPMRHNMGNERMLDRAFT